MEYLIAIIVVVVFVVFVWCITPDGTSNRTKVNNNQVQKSMIANATKHCPECGAVAEKDDVYCVSCGKKL